MESEERKPLNPWLHIWIHPKRTIRSILDTNPKRAIHWIALVWGVLTGISQLGYLSFKAPENLKFQTMYFLIGMVVFGILLGFLNLYFGGWLYQLTGSWIGGKGDFKQLRCAMGWALYPFSLSSLFSILTVFTVPSPWLMPIFGLLYAITGIWALVILFNLIGEAHRFTAWKGLATVFIGLVLVFVAVMIISLIAPLLTPLFQ